MGSADSSGVDGSQRGAERTQRQSPGLTFAAREKASCDATVLFPTPPFPERTSSCNGRAAQMTHYRVRGHSSAHSRGKPYEASSTLCLTPESFSTTTASAGSISFPAPLAHADWLGHPAQLAAFPACEDIIEVGRVSWGTFQVNDALRFGSKVEDYRFSFRPNALLPRRDGKTKAGDQKTLLRSRT